jgi:hypothetical protein
MKLLLKVSSKRRHLMKKIVNLKVSPYFTLRRGETITLGGSMVVLNDDILDSSEVKKAVDEGLIRIDRG